MAMVLSAIYASGGQCKTSTVEFLAEIFEAIGYDTLVIDLEPQHSLTNYYQADAEGKPTIAEVLLGEAGIRDAVRTTEKGDIIPATRLLAAVEDRFKAEGRFRGLEMWMQLSEKLSGIEDDYDVILIDTPTELRFFTINAALASDGIIIPIIPEKFEPETYRETVDTLKSVLAASPRDGRIYGVCMTKVTRGRVLTRETAAELEKATAEDGLKLLPCIYTCEEVAKAQKGKVKLYRQAPNCEAFGCFVKLAKAILEEYGTED